MEKIQVALIYDKNSGYLHEDRCVFMIISRRILVKNVSESSRRENQNTHFVFVFFFPPAEDRSVYEICGKVW